MTSSKPKGRSVKREWQGDVTAEEVLQRTREAHKELIKEALREEAERVAKEVQFSYQEWLNNQPEPCPPDPAPLGFIRPIRGKQVDLCIDMINGKQYQYAGAVSYTFVVFAGKEWLEVTVDGTPVQLVDALQILSVSGPQWIKGAGR